MPDFTIVHFDDEPSTVLEYAKMVAYWLYQNADDNGGDGNYKTSNEDPLALEICDFSITRNGNSFEFEWRVYDHAKNCMEALKEITPCIVLADLFEQNGAKLVKSGEDVLTKAKSLLPPERMFLLTAYPDLIPPEIIDLLPKCNIKEKSVDTLHIREQITGILINLMDAR